MSFSFCQSRLLKGALVAVFATLTIACSNDKAVDPPAELVDIKPTLKVDKLWSESLDGKGDRLRLALQPSIVDGVVYAASHKGEVNAFSADKGKRIWRVKTKLPLSAGPSVADGLVVIGASDGQLIALDAATGQEKWRHQMSGEVLAKPLIAQGVVVVRTVNGRLQALNAVDASPKWAAEEPVPKLTLRGTAAPVLAGTSVVTGFDNGKLVAVDLATGDAVWNVTIDTASGRTELDRLADLDATAAASGRDVFAVGFQGRLTMLEIESGQIWWAKDVSSYRGFGLDDTVLYLSQSNGMIIAVRRTDGAQQWEQNGLHQRGLTAPAVNGDNLIVGDYEGYVHWLNKADGTIAARAKTDGDRISNAPVVADGRVFVQTDGGKLIVFQTKPIG
jgi:outer membrane protein assembly factor BamB